MGLPLLQKHGKEAHVSNFGIEPGAFGIAMFAVILSCFVARQSRHNRTTFGVLLRNDGNASTSCVLPRFWNHGQNCTILVRLGVNGALKSTEICYYEKTPAKEH